MSAATQFHYSIATFFSQLFYVALTLLHIHKNAQILNKLLKIYIFNDNYILKKSLKVIPACTATSPACCLLVINGNYLRKELIEKCMLYLFM